MQRHTAARAHFQTVKAMAPEGSPAAAAADTKRKQLWRQRNHAMRLAGREDEHHLMQCATAAGVDLAALRLHSTLEYDTSLYKFRELVIECLGIATPLSSTEGDAALEGLEPLAEAERLQRKFRGGDRGPSSHWIQRWLSEAPEFRKAHAAFNTAYLSFLRHEILPHIGDPRGLLFQRRPTFRCHVAGGGEATGVAHRDVDNGHPSSEGVVAATRS